MPPAFALRLWDLTHKRVAVALSFARPLFCARLLTDAAMARTKTAPKKIIEKTSTARVVSDSTQKKRGQCLEEILPAQVYTSPDGVRGEVLLLRHGQSVPVASKKDGARALSMPSTARRRRGGVGVNVTPSPLLAAISANGYPAAGVNHGRMHTHIVLLPGNPGVIEYYRPVLRRIFERLPHDVSESTSIHGLGLPGHDVRELNGAATFNIADHKKYVMAFLDSTNLSPPLAESRLVFIGHSYGSFLSLKVLNELGQSVRARASLVLLMPALWHMARCAGTAMCLLLRDALGATTWTSWALTAALPERVRNKLIGLLDHDPAVQTVTGRVVDGRRHGLYRNICNLARDEMVNIMAPRDNAAAAALGPRTLFLHANRDRWCPPDAQSAIKEAFGPELTVEFTGEHVEHAFVLEREQSESVASSVASWVAEFVRSSEKVFRN